MNDRVLEIERLIPAPPERVFDYWTEPELLAKWFGPEGFDIPTKNLDVRPGGKWRTTMRTPDGQLRTVSGVYNLIDRPRRLVFTWGWDDDSGLRGHETEVTVTLEPTPGGTRLKLVQQLFQTSEVRQLHNRGWASSFNKLQKLAL
ncbi:MAG TPA: SRPBCC domain-containing protein [Xanthobacteraceae bacterium]|jgi:uncharacterized protein YndB with AHSA1/START domain|nr:SRPBCC domain-containing protein [Xanthobacteraceae bacterium]